MTDIDSLDAVQRLSFQSLNQDCANMLGIMCYLTPDSIPQTLFESVGGQDLPPELDFCRNKLALSGILDELLALALIKQDKSTRIISLHCLLQQEFRDFSSPAGNQRFFDYTTCLLFEAFPQSDAKKGQLYDRWTECQRYLQHVLSLKNQYKAAATSKQPLTPSLKFCMLLKSLARFLLESASYMDVEDTLGEAISSFDKIAPGEKNRYLYADLCASSGLAWAHRGFFSLARPWLEKSHQIRSAADPPNRSELSWAEINMANMEASLGNFSSSLDWQIKALRNRQSTDADDSKHMHTQAILYQNLGRSKYLVGNFSEAHIWCHIAVRLLSESRNWAMLAYTYFVRGNIGRAEGDFARAQEEYARAQRAWVEKGLALAHHFNVACLYKLGCVALDQDDPVSAI